MRPNYSTHPATLNDALAFVRGFTRLASSHGYMLAIYGSTVLSEAGRDVDVIAVPWRPHASPSAFVAALLSDGGFVQIGEVYRGAMETYSVNLVRRHEKHPVIDLQIREVAGNGPIGS
jgi:hypothetical protein